MKKNDRNTVPDLIRRYCVRGIFFVVFLVAFAAILIYFNRGKEGYYAYLYSKMSYETARVLEVLEDTTEVQHELEDIMLGTMQLRIEILTGEYKGDTAEITNYFTKQYNIYVTEGDKISVRLDLKEDGGYTVSFYNNYNKGPLLLLVALFVISLIGLGGKKGVSAVLGLGFTLVSIVFLLIPLLMKGYPTIPVTIAVIVFTTMISFSLISGFTAKTLTAIAGCTAGLIVAGVLAVVFGHLTQITGYTLDEAESLLLIVADSELRIKGLFTCGVLIAAEGAVMDIAMSIASAMQEMKENNPSVKPEQLFRSGMNIGRDAMGTMANTLILAFAGAAIGMIVLIYIHNISFNQLINTSFLAIEAIRGLAGSLGIIFTVPAVSFAGSRIIGGKSVN